MKRALLILLLIAAVGYANSQTTYYWVGGVASANGISIGSNWNTSLDGSGGTRPSATGASDILVFDGTNVGGATPVSDTVTVQVNTSITCAQMKFVNNAWAKMIRPTGGTSTVTINGEAGDDFVVDASSGVIFNSVTGSIRMQMQKTATITTTGRVSGTVKTISPLQIRFDNTISGLPGTFIFTSGSKLFTNITAASASYAFGNSGQSSEKWVVFEAGSHLYYDGGSSPIGSGANFSAIDMKLGSTWHHRATNVATEFGNFFVRKNFGNVIVENNAILTAKGPIYSMENLTITTGSTFNVYDQGGQTGVLGNLVVNGTLTAASGGNELIMAGNAAQTISGTGTINVPSLIIADNANVTLAIDITVSNSTNIYGKINFGTNKITGAGTFKATGITTPITATGNLFVDSIFIKGNSGIPTTSRGLRISGAGIAPNTSIVAFSVTGDTVFISKPVTASGTGVTLTVSSNGAVLETANTNGFDPATGSVTLTGSQTYQDNINYIIDGATGLPFGVSTSSSPTDIHAAFVEINAPVTFNRSVIIADHLTVNGKITLNPLGSVHIANTGSINGTFGPSAYIATGVNTTNGDKAVLQIDGVNGSRVFPVGSVTNYLPVTLSPVSSSDFAVTTFEGITSNGTPNGTPLTALEKQTVVDAVWNINRIAGSGDAAVQLNWNGTLEGATFTTLPNTDIGLIKNNGTAWMLPIGTADNTANTATATVNSFGAFSAGAVPQVDPFVYNTLPAKTYGDPDFSGGATSLNTTQPIMYSSNNPAVATIVAGNIHIVGAGTAVITASQTTDGVYSAVSMPQTLTVDRAALQIKADNKLKFEGVANPALTATYTSFVSGETPAVFLTPLVITTTAVTASPPGTYPITVSGATSNNYNITFVNGVLTVQPKQTQTISFGPITARNYGAADFSTGVTSTNTTIPVTYTSSNTNVATVNGSGTIHITGAGTTNITAKQAGNDGYFPATDVQQTLIVNKVPLTVRVRDTSKVEFQPNPVFTITYTGFVLGETPASLTAQPVASTVATTNSLAGNYSVTPVNGASQNYNFTYIAGRLTVLPSGDTTRASIVAFQNANGNLTVRVYSTFPTLGDIVVFDMSGRPIARRNIFMPDGFAEVEVFVPRATSGIHIVKLKGNGIDLVKMVSIIK
jgi:hypothetical protein